MSFDDPQPSSFSVPEGGLSARVAPITDAGRKQGHNEDNHRRVPRDGSGAPQCGEVSTLPIDAPGLLFAQPTGAT